MKRSVFLICVKMFFFNSKKIEDLFEKKKFKKIVSNFLVDENIDQTNWKKNFLIAKSFYHLQNYNKSLDILNLIDQKISYHEIKFLKANIYRIQGQLKLALDFYKKAINLNDSKFIYYNEIGSIYLISSNFDLAIEYFKKALSFKTSPDIESALLFNIGFTYQKLGKFDLAIDFSKKALDINSNLLSAWDTLGISYSSIKNKEKAIESFLGALKINPNYLNSLNNLAVLYTETGNFDLAIQYFQKIIKTNSSNSAVFLNLAKCQNSIRKFDEALISFKKAIDLDRNNYTAISNYLLSINYLDKLDKNLIFQEHLKFGNNFSFNLFNSPVETKSYKKKIRIGFVSGDFRRHAVMQFFTPIIKNFNRNQYEFFCFSNSPIKDDYTDLVKSNSDFVEIFNKSDDEVIKIIHQNEINILVDLAGHTKDNRMSLFAKKPCSVQISWIGYPNTTGIRAIDYRIVDNFTDPDGNNSFCTEKLIRLNNFFMIYDPPKEYEIFEPPVFKNNYITFGSFNNLNKLNQKTLQIWAALLKKNNNNKLVLKSFEFKDQNIINSVRDELINLGLEKQQIIFYEKLDLDSHYNLYNKIDIALDPITYNGTTTSMEALWMGVPLVALEGDTHRSRVSHSILMNINCPELSAKSEFEYIQKNFELMNSLEKIKTYKQTLREKIQNSPIMDYKNFLNELENVFLELLK